MKTFLKLIIISIVFFTSASVLAFNPSINLSDDINVLYYDTNNIKIKLTENLKNNNSTIYYQFMPSTEEEINNFENKNNEAFEKLSTCLDNKDQEECINRYNAEKDIIASNVPEFGKNWNTAKSDGTSIYSVPKYYDNYYLWVKALDKDGKEIYALFYEASNMNNQMLSGVTTTNGLNNINEVVAMASILFSAGGMICFVGGIAYILKYGKFKFKFNY